jgi:hypothetical protein
MDRMGAMTGEDFDFLKDKNELQFEKYLTQRHE